MSRLLLLLVIMSMPSASLAQTPLRPDSIPWRPILNHVIAQLSNDILLAATAPAPRSWSIVLPDSSAPWLQVATHLRSALRARLPRSDDIEFDEITIGPMRFSGDTATVRLTRDHGSHCPGRTQRSGYGNIEEVQIYQVQGRFWSAARSLGVLHGDRGPCS